MYIHQSLDAPLTSVYTTNSTKTQSENSKEQINYTGPVNTAVDVVTISAHGSLNQNIDSLFNKADAIYQLRNTMMPIGQYYSSRSLFC